MPFKSRRLNRFNLIISSSVKNLKFHFSTLLMCKSVGYAESERVYNFMRYHHARVILGSRIYLEFWIFVSHLSTVYRNLDG